MKPATWTRSGSTITITEPAHGRSAGQGIRITSDAPLSVVEGAYVIQSATSADTFTITGAWPASSGTLNVFSLLGGVNGFVANAAGTTAQQIAVDLVLPAGLYHTSPSGAIEEVALAVVCEVQAINDAGTPIAGWVSLGEQRISDRTNTPIRLSYRWDVSPGRYRVRAFRTDVKSTSDNDGHTVLLAGLRAYLAGGQVFPDVTVIAVRMRATNNLSLQASRRISVLSTRKLPVWNGTSWSDPVPTRSIAWAIANAARSPFYSVGLLDREIDLAGLLALDALWSARGDAFDHRFDQAGTWWDAIQTIARAGRAQCALQGGILRTVRDGPASVPVVMFSERNIAEGSLGVSYIHATADTADAIRATYWDAQTWSEQTVTGKLPGSTAVKPSKVTLTGVTSRAQALRDATYLAAANGRRRRIVRFLTEMEGRLPVFGDLISIQHSMPGWGQQAEVVAWDPADRRLNLSEPMVWTPGRPHGLLLRRKNGSSWGIGPVSPGATAYEILLPSAPDFPVVVGPDRVKTHAAFGPDSTWSALAKVARVTPRGLYEYEIEAVVEDPSVHTADQGIVAPPVTYSQLPKRVVQPIIQNLVGRRMPGSTTRVLLSWTPAPNAQSYQVEMAEGDDPVAAAVTWTRVADTTASSVATDLLYAARTMVRIRGIGLAAGPWHAIAIGDLITEFWPTDATSFWGDDTASFWSN